MSENNRKGSDGSKLEEVALGAIGVGVGLSAIYSGGGNKLLSRSIKQITKMYEAIDKDVANKTLEEIDFKKLLDKHLLDSDSTWKTLKERPDVIEFDNSAKDLFNHFKEFLNFEKNPKQVLSQLYDAKLTTKIKNDLVEQFAKDDEKLQNMIYNFVDDVKSNFDDITERVLDDNGKPVINKERLDRFLKDSGLELEDKVTMFEKVVNDINEGNVEEFANSDEGRELMNNIKEKFFDYKTLEKKFGSKTKEKGSQKFLSKVLDNAATLGEVLDERNEDKLKGFKQFFNGSEGIEEIDMIERLRAFVDKNPEYKDLYVGGAYRKNAQGEIYSLKDAKNLFNKMVDEFQTTLPGKIFKVRDVMQNANAPSYRLWTEGEHDFVLGEVDRKLSKSTKKSNTLINNNYIRIHDKTYRINGSELYHLPELDDTYLISGKHGTQIRLMKDLAGDVDYLAKDKNKVTSFLDMFSTTETNKIDETKSIFTKFTNEGWTRNLVNSFLYTDIKKMFVNIDDKNYLISYGRKTKELNRFFANSTANINKSTASKLESLTHGNAKEAFKILQLSDDKMLRRLSSIAKKNDAFLNPDLISLTRKYINNPKKAMDTISIIKDKGILGGTKANHFVDIIRKEVAKEGFLQHVYKQNNGRYNSIYELIRDAGIKGNEAKQVKHLANWSIFQKVSNNYHFGIKQKDKLLTLDSLQEVMARTQQLFSLKASDFDGQFVKEFRETTEAMAKDYAPITEKGVTSRNKNIIEGNKYGDWTMMRKRIRLMDTIKNLNDKEKVKAYGKQWVAGRNNMENVTTATLFPYFSAIRLVDPLNQIGLGFSAKSTGSVGDVAWNILTRRVLPIMAGTTLYSYLDYRSKAYTGTSVTGAFANSVANLDLKRRKVFDVLGLTDSLKERRETNVIAQYTSNNTPYMGYDEKKQYYESGYVPVRSGRWWSFGSSSEWRGGKIDYYQPNFLIRSHSDWYDNSVYGSTDEKWKHSWIPTPRHPLSPIRALLDPYWLERKHYWDRPYPLSGKMFEENTPWGFALNATVGRVLKPQMRMHKRELTSNMIDVRDIIERRNKNTMKMAQNNASLVRLSEDYNVEPVSFTPISSPNGSDIYVNYNKNNGQPTAGILGGGYAYNARPIEEYGSTSFDLGRHRTKFQVVKDKIDFKADDGNPIAKTLRDILFVGTSRGESLSNIKNINAGIFSRARQPKGSIISDPIFNYRAKDTNNILYDQEALADLKNSSNSKEALEDGLYSAKEILGIYGFMIDSTLSHSKRYRLANAKDMTSYAKKFWDNAIGGYGGEFMEIARRFFPHENHDIQKVNPLRNTMPDWMPERFKHGDPYASIPKGDMRLPGKGYESIYAIHPDQFGRYGAYDRMKILADIAPWSREYKLWKDIASKTVQDPVLKRQMQNIKDRVTEQSKMHDFYDYKFIGAGKINSQKAIINKIISNNEFTVIGSNKVYKLAGIKMKQGAEGNSLNKFLREGSTVILKTNSDIYDEKKNQTSKAINAVVYVGKENLNKQLLKEKVAESNKDNSPVAIMGRYGNKGIARGRIFELIGHAPIPFIHNKFMKIESPFESWKRSQIYGKSYSTWGHPIQGFIMPSLQTQWSYGLPLQMLSIGSFFLANQVGKNGSRAAKVLAYGAASLVNPAAVMGGTVGFITKLNSENILRGAKIGQAFGALGYAYTHLDRPVDSAIGFGALGAWTTRYIIKSKKISNGTGALIGAGLGLSLSAIKNPGFNKDKMFGPYIPKSRKKQWEIEEYYDRLKYIKYMGLYNKAARKAASKEHVDIKKIMNKIEYQRKKAEKKKREILLKANKISNSYSENDIRREHRLRELYKDLNDLKGNETIVKAGKYTRAAIAYKFAADSTIYGLKENATWSQILRALPKNNRDYFLEFAKENDPKKRKKILKYISPYQRKVLKIAWGEKYKEEKSNYSYFKRKFLPGTFWAGWQPDVNLDNVEIKEIKNEGMMLSDFGFYESQANSVEAKKAPTINRNSNQSVLEMQKNMLTALTGAGLTGVDVSIEPSEKPGIQMVANIFKSDSYEIKSKINQKLGNAFY